MGSRLDADQIVQKFAIQLLMEAVRDHVGSKLDAKAGFIIGVGSGILIVSFFGPKPPSSDGEGFSRFFAP